MKRIIIYHKEYSFSRGNFRTLMNFRSQVLIRGSQWEMLIKGYKEKRNQEPSLIYLKTKIENIETMKLS